jgi:hypothetical protein
MLTRAPYRYAVGVRAEPTFSEQVIRHLWHLESGGLFIDSPSRSRALPQNA